MDSWGNGSKWGLLVVGEIVFTGRCKYVFSKKHTSGNAYARINCINSIDTVGKILLYNCRIRLTHIIMR